METHQLAAGTNTPQKILFASVVGTTIEFFDFYIYATAAVLVFPRLFFPAADATSSALASFATFGIAFLARPIGSALFGHFGDRIGRKRTLVAALSTMGVSTFLIGIVPGYATIGVAAPLLLALCRFGQGIGLGGEVGGAVLLAVENAPPRKRALYGMFPQLGAPIGFLLSGSTFLLLSRYLTNAQFLAYGWRYPFLASALLIVLGLYVRFSLSETPVFRESLTHAEPIAFPGLALLGRHKRALVGGTLVGITTFTLFYLMTVFALYWATKVLHYTRGGFLLIQLLAVLFFALAIPVAGLLAERGRRSLMLAVTVCIGLYGLAFAPLFSAGRFGAVLMMILGMVLMGMTWGPLGTLLSELFPTSVRYTGSAFALSTSGILGASLAPGIATWLASRFGLPYVGYYLSASALVSLLGIVLIRETRDEDLTAIPR